VEAVLWTPFLLGSFSMRKSSRNSSRVRRKVDELTEMPTEDSPLW